MLIKGLLKLIGLDIRDQNNQRPTQEKQKTKQLQAARENPLLPTKYSTFASTESKVSASYEGRTDDLLQQTLRSFIAKTVVLPIEPHQHFC
jgi:hypothetical protein